MLLGELARASINTREVLWFPGVPEDFWRWELGGEGEPAQSRCSHERQGNRLSNWECKVTWAGGAVGQGRGSCRRLKGFLL